MKNLVIFVHFNKKNSLKKHVLYSLQSIRQQYDEIVVISNSGMSKRNTALLKRHCDSLIFRKNHGYDFAAWRDGMKHMGWDKLEQFDSITLMNDTSYFPIFPMNNVYKKFDQNRDIDFWGASIHAATSTGMPGTNGPVDEHIQSYFMCFKKNVVHSRIFQEFWENIEDLVRVEDVINRYETKLTFILKKAKFKYDAIYNPKYSGDKNLTDAVYEIPTKLIERSFPFLKLKVVNQSSRDSLLEALSASSSTYPKEYVESHGTSSVLKKSAQYSKKILRKALRK
jgi:rhamnosyltransferase